MAPTYTSASGFKSVFGISSSFTDDDTYIGSLLETEEGVLQDDLGYTFGEDSDREDEWNVSLGRIIIPPKIPISSIDTLKIDLVTISSSYYDISEDSFFIWLDDDYDYGYARVEIYLKYTCGYTTSTIPEALKNVLYWRAGYIYADNRTTVRAKAGGLKGRFEGKESLWTKAEQIVQKYKLYNIEMSGKIG